MYRLARRRENRHAGVQTESRAERLGGRLETAHSCNYSVNDHEIIDKILQFHGSLAALESVMCFTCLEQFPSINVNVAGLCHHCHLDASVKYYTALRFLSLFNFTAEVRFKQYKLYSVHAITKLSIEILHLTSLAACFYG